MSSSFLPIIWDLTDRFEENFKSKGWRVYEDDEVVEVEGEYHRFVWTHQFHLSTFKKVVTDDTVHVREELSHRRVRVSYIAWILCKPSLPSVWLYLIKDAPHLSTRVALYDLSPAYKGRSMCPKLNETGRTVFEEFERFVEREYGVKLHPLTRIRPFSSQERSPLKVRGK